MPGYLKVSFPPFVHSKNSLRSWWRDLAAAFFPLWAAVVLFGAGRGPVLTILPLFLMCGLAYNYVKKLPVSSGFLKYSVWGLMLSSIVPGSESFLISSLCVVISFYLENEVFCSPGISVFPPVITGWLFMEISGSVPRAGLTGNMPLTVLTGAGCAFLLLRRRLSPGMFFAAVSALVLVVAMTDRNLWASAQPFLISMLVLAYPGIVPVTSRARFFYGIVCGGMIAFLGFRGFVLSLPVALLSEEM
ncbi:MAG: hypothetical protein JXJ19_04080 [Elusimicrobia bacterium]|nr:hypothetical protein [Elusimicrobiota bacterium]